MTRNWHPVKLADARRAQRRQIKGVDFEVHFSPFDLPDGVRGDYCPKRNRFVIEFHYPGLEERTTDREADEHITFVVGRNSGRLYEIVVDVRAMNAQAVSLRAIVSEQVDRALAGSVPQTRDVRTGNLSVIREAVANSRPEIFEPLPIH
ncbi:MAG TPA: hypothetical protein P5572_16155 [Phycisphaerae bacterium]|nr:hypothetical protein [Phycisphaerales bacterium]HRX86556.1 hypothetical protein [Phycisphaerae bacterium]